MIEAIIAQNSRHERAAALAATGAVTLRADGTATVRSQTDPAVCYVVDPNNRYACDCPDRLARRGECKHARAVRYVLRAIRLAEDCADDELELRGRRATAERLAEDPTRGEFERNLCEVLARAYRLVWAERYGRPEDGGTVVPAATLARAKALYRQADRERQERERWEREHARPAPYYRRTPGRRWKA